MDATPEEHGSFEVTIQSALMPEFQTWLDSRDLILVPFGPNEAGTPTYVTTIKPGSALEARFKQAIKQARADKGGR